MQEEAQDARRFSTPFPWVAPTQPTGASLTLAQLWPCHLSCGSQGCVVTDPTALCMAQPSQAACWFGAALGTCGAMCAWFQNLFHPHCWWQSSRCRRGGVPSRCSSHGSSLLIQQFLEALPVSLHRKQAEPSGMLKFYLPSFPVPEFLFCDRKCTVPCLAARKCICTHTDEPCHEPHQPSDTKVFFSLLGKIFSWPWSLLGSREWKGAKWNFQLNQA